MILSLNGNLIDGFEKTSSKWSASNKLLSVAKKVFYVVKFKTSKYQASNQPFIDEQPLCQSSMKESYVTVITKLK